MTTSDDHLDTPSGDRAADHVEPLIEESIEIAAAPAQVWSVVSDLARMADWSPQVMRTFVRGGQIKLGTKAINLNRQGFLVWPTNSKVVRFDPHREFGFRIKENQSIWSFTLEPTENGTRVTQRREAPDGTTKLSETLIDKVLGGQSDFQTGLRRGMQQTLMRIKADIEG